MNEIFKLIAESGRTDLMEEWYKIEKKLEVFDVIKEKQVDVWLLQQCDYKNYIRIRKEAEIEDELTEEEFELVKEEIKDYGSKKES